MFEIFHEKDGKGNIFAKVGEEFFLWREYCNGGAPLPKEQYEALEAMLEADKAYWEKIREEKYGPRPENDWDYIEYLKEEERREGYDIPDGNIEPPDAYYETGAPGLG